MKELMIRGKLQNQGSTKEVAVRQVSRKRAGKQKTGSRKSHMTQEDIISKIKQEISKPKTPNRVTGSVIVSIEQMVYSITCQIRFCFF